MKTVLTIARADWGVAIHATARRLAYVVAVLVVAAEITYRAGLATGRAIYWLSDRLAGLASGRIDRAQTARAVVVWARSILATEPMSVATESAWRRNAAARKPAASSAEHAWRKTQAAPAVVMPCAPIPAPPVAISAPPLDSLTVVQLRKLARARGLSSLARKGRRADLLSALTD